MKNMKDKIIRILCAVTALASVLTVVTIMFEFFEDYITLGPLEEGYFVPYYGFSFYSDKDLPFNILLGVIGLVALLWDLVYAGYALIDGRYRNLTWRIARYGYFYGVIAGILNLALVLSWCFGSMNVCTFGMIYIILLGLIVILKFFLIFLKDENTKSAVSNEQNG